MGELINLNPPTPIADSDIPGGIARDAEVTAAMNAHLDHAHPHLQYPTQAAADARYFRGRSQVETVNPPSLGPSELYKIYFTFVGARPGDACFVTPINVNLYEFALWPFHIQGMIEQSDLIAIDIWNGFSSPINLGSFQIRALVINF